MTGRATVRLLTAGLIVLIGSLTSAPAVAEQSPGRCEPNHSRKLTLVTVPSVAGFTFTVGSRRYTTDAQGQAVLRGVTCRGYEKALGAVTDQVDQGNGTTAIFDSWFAESELGRSFGNAKIYARFRQTSQVRFSLYDLQGNPVPRSSVGDITLKGSTGAMVDVKPGQDTIVLDSSRVVRFAAGLVSKDITWSLQSVEMDGNSVVDRGGVRFSPRSTPNVRISLQLYPMTIQVHDAILGLGVGRDVLLTAPNGTTRTIALDGSGYADVGLLGRGSYTLQAQGGSIAMAFVQPVAMSRPQDAELTVVSDIDLLIFGAVIFLSTVGLLVLGYRIRRREPAAPPARSRAAGRPRSPVTAGQGAGR